MIGPVGIPTVALTYTTTAIVNDKKPKKNIVALCK